MPETVETLSAPVLQDKIIEHLRSQFAALEWLEACYPLTQIGIKALADGTRYRVPVVYRNDGTTYQAELFPDEKKTSFGFFEMESPFRRDVNADISDIIYNLSFVAWLNLPKIDGGKGYDFTQELVYDIAQILESSGAYDWTADVRHQSVFSKYDYDQAARQFMIYPFAGFKVTFEFRSTMICMQEVIPEMYYPLPYGYGYS